jgi:hypothetical protein
VGFFFSHCEYQTIVLDLFCTALANSLIMISFDVHVYDKYSKKLFHLNDHCAQLNFPLLTQILSLTSPVSSHTNKWVALLQPSVSANSSMCVDVPSQKWNLGSCKSDVCPNRRKHGF